MPTPFATTEVPAPCGSETTESFAARIAVAARAATAETAPGALLTVGIAAAAFAAHRAPGLSALSPLILSIVLGAALNNVVGTPAWAKAGVTFSLRRVLRLGIILLGLQLTAEQVVDVGAGGLAIIALTLVATFVFTTWLGRAMGVERKLTQLIAAGTSICGASAVIATNTVTEGSDEDVAYAIACVTIFGSLAMISYPLLPGLLHLDPRGYGLWAGASIHEIAQVVAAAFQDGSAAGEFGTIAKLSRVTLLAPVVLTLGFIAVRNTAGQGQAPVKRPPIPWFVLGFIALIAVNSVIHVPGELKGMSAGLTTFLLSMSLAAMGHETDIAKLKAKGAKPLMLGAAAAVFIAIFSLTLIKLMG
jgi:uncharacterized integral membrane protein (TIGR00698 family)